MDNLKGTKLLPSMRRLQTASGQELTIKGILRAPMRLGNQIIMADLSVVKGVTQDCIIGNDIMCEAGVTIDMKRKKILFPKKNAPPREWVGTLKKRTLIPPLSTKIVKINIKGNPQEKNENAVCCLLERSKTGEEFEMYPNVIRLNGNERTIIGNPTTETVVLTRGLEVCTVTPVDPKELKVQEYKKPGRVSEVRESQNDVIQEIDFSRVPKEKKVEYRRLFNSFKGIFSRNELDVGRANVLQQTITLKDPAKISYTPQYRLPHHLKIIAEQYIDTLLKAGIIQESRSPFSSPLMLVRKACKLDPSNPLKNYRVVLDYRRLNENTVPDSYPMRHLSELIDSVSQSKIWTVLDISQGYFNQILDPKSRKYSAFGLPSKGHFEFTRSPQGMRNSGAAFQRLLDYITQGIKGVSVYIDDIIIASNSHDDHIRTLKILFQRIAKYNLKLKPSKIQLAATSINYLGFDISQSSGIRAGAAKTKAIVDWKIPTNVKEIKQFLGLCSFFRRTIKDFSMLASPLTKLTRKGAYSEGPLTPEAVEAFHLLKGKLMSRPCLSPVDFEKQFIVTVDASTKGLGAILSQVGKDGVERPNAYASRVLKDSESKYSPHHLESLGMLWACKHFKPYLVGKEFVIRTDHKPLVALNRVQGQALERVRAEMEEFLPYKVQYLKGEKMPADGLSRLGECCDVSSFISWPQVFSAQRMDAGAKALVCWLKFKQRPQNPKLNDLLKECEGRIKLVRGVVCAKSGLPFVPSALRPSLLRLAHDSVLSGHFGPRKTFERLQQDWFWPSMESDCKTHCDNCIICSRNRITMEHRNPLRPLPQVSRFNERIHIDLMGPLPAVAGNKYILVMVDAFSALISLAPIPDKTAESVSIALLTNWIQLHGVPKTMNSDQGKEFVNDLFKKLCTDLKIDHKLSSVMHPQSNGRAERQVRQVIVFLRKYLDSQRNDNDWERLLPALQFAYNSGTHSTKGYSPFMIAFNRRPNLPSSLLVSPTTSYSESDFQQRLKLLAKITQDVIRHDELSFGTNKRLFDRKVRACKIEVNDIVYVNRPKTGQQFQKFQDLKMGPFVVMAVLEHEVKVMELTTGKVKNFHKNRITLGTLNEQFIGLQDQTFQYGYPGRPGPRPPKRRWADPFLDPFNEDNDSQPPPVAPPRLPAPPSHAPPVPPRATPPPPPPLPPRSPGNPSPQAESRHTRAAGPAPEYPHVMDRPIEFLRRHSNS